MRANLGWLNFKYYDLYHVVLIRQILNKKQKEGKGGKCILVSFMLYFLSVIEDDIYHNLSKISLFLFYVVQHI